MEKIQEKNHIKVFNYTPSKVGVDGRTRSYIFNPAQDDVPSLEYMNFEDIEYINSKGEIFRNGTLRFEPDEEAEIFNLLGYPDYKQTLFTEEDIDSLILNPTIENQKKLLAITNNGTIERIRGRLVYFNNIGRDDVPHRMTTMIKERFEELRDGHTKSRIEVSEVKASPIAVNPAEVDNLKAQNESLQSELAEMKAMMKQLMEQASAEKKEPEKKETVTKEKTATKTNKATTKKTEKE